MKLATLLFMLAMIPAFSHADEKGYGNLEFPKSRLAKVKHVMPLRMSDMTDTFRFVPSALKSIEGASSHS